VTTAADAPAAYDGFDTMPIAGTWRRGSSGKTVQDTDPYTGDVLTELALADADDLDEAYRAAAQAQVAWAARTPGERAAVMRQAAAVMDARKEEVVGWTARKTAATRATAACSSACASRQG
jgi:aldehyde dehydrogenase (NAD+)